MRWIFKDDFLIINRTKIPLISCSDSTGLLRMTDTKPCETPICNIPNVDIVKKECIPLYAKFPLEIPSNSTRQLKLGSRCKTSEGFISSNDYIVIPKKFNNDE